MVAILWTTPYNHKSIIFLLSINNGNIVCKNCKELKFTKGISIDIRLVVWNVKMEEGSIRSNSSIVLLARTLF